MTTVSATASPGASSIAVISPNGGETWKQNTTHPVTWSYTGNPGSTVKIELMKNGIFYQLLTPGTSMGSAGSGRIHGRSGQLQNLVLIIKSGLPVRATQPIPT